jgi:transcription initiation factor IIE alpha subunit
MNKQYDENLKIVMMMESYQANGCQSPDELLDEVLSDEGLVISDERKADIYDIFYEEFFVCQECGYILDLGEAHELADGLCQECGEDELRIETDEY